MVNYLLTVLAIYAIFYALGTNGFRFIKDIFNKDIIIFRQIYKVFNCAFCFGFWSYLFLQLISKINIMLSLSIVDLFCYLIEIIKYSLACGVLVLVIELIIKKLEIIEKNLL